MQITLPDNLKLQQQAMSAGYATLEEYVMELLERDAERVAIQQGLDDIKAGRVISYEDMVAGIRKEFGIPSNP